MSQNSENLEEQEDQVIADIDSSILKQFKQYKQDKPEEPDKHVIPIKKENLNTHIIRTVQKIINCLINGVKPSKRKFMIFNLNDKSLNDVWRKIDQAYYNNIDLFKQKEQLKTGSIMFKSMNSLFLKEFFKGSFMNEFFQLVVDLLFHIRDIRVLEVNLMIRCCTEKQRCEDCSIKWNELEYYMRNSYIANILNS